MLLCLAQIPRMRVFVLFDKTSFRIHNDRAARGGPIYIKR
jgi:hypothetical protein